MFWQSPCVHAPVLLPVASACCFCLLLQAIFPSGQWRPLLLDWAPSVLAAAEKAVDEMQAELDGRAAHVQELEALHEKLQVGRASVARFDMFAVVWLLGGCLRILTRPLSTLLEAFVFSSLPPCTSHQQVNVSRIEQTSALLCRSFFALCLQVEVGDLTQRCTQLHNENVHLSSMLAQRDNELLGEPAVAMLCTVSVLGPAFCRQ